MKIKIIKKSIKEGDGYCIKSLFCSVDNKEDANVLAMSALEAGATKEQVASLIKAGEYNGAVTYAFGLNCSNFTFEHVERFGVIDATIVFVKNDKGYVNAKIQIIDKVEQVHGYEPPESDVTGWASPAPEIKTHQSIGDGSHAELNPIEPFGIESNSLNPIPGDLPF